MFKINMPSWISRLFGHLADSQILLFDEDELSPQSAEAARQHLDTCARCAARRHELTDALQMASRLRFAEPRVQASVAVERWTVAIAATTAVLIAVVLISQWNSKSNAPDARLTPGAVLALSRDEVCGKADVEDIVPVSLAQRVFQEYGINNPAPRAYEMDYLITPALGGARDIRNLWPQPYSRGEWNARVKDALEDHLRALVCAGQLDLRDAQKDLSADWVAAYRKYFQTSSPLASHRSFSKDMPWE